MMKTENRQFDKRRGSALILVVVVTVLLAVVGVMFLMVSRASELETGAVVQSKDLDSAIDSVVAKINEVLVEDLFGNNNIVVDGDFRDESYDAVVFADRWLASLEPKWENFGDADPTNDAYVWPRITDLYANGISFAGIPFSYYDPQDDTIPAQWDGTMTDLRVDATNTLVKVIAPKDRTKVILQGATGTAIIPNPWDDETQTFPYGARADADGDGVADSRWVQIPGLTTSRGEPVFAAVRIIDNCAMLNLNTAFGFYQTGLWHSSQWNTSANNDATSLFPYNYDGRTLSEINFTPFLRSYDIGRPERIQLFRDARARSEHLADPLYSYLANPTFYHNQLVMQIENPIVMTSLGYKSIFQTFDVGDELEIRNRYLLTSKTIASFEKRDPDEQADKDLFPPFMSAAAKDYDGVAYETFDLSRGTDVATGLDNWNNDWNAKVKAVPFENIINWAQKLDSDNFVDDGDASTTHDYEYDRRHVCTFYSFDRPLPKGNYPVLGPILNAMSDSIKGVFVPKGTATTNIETPLAVDAGGNSVPYNNVETRRKILHLLYAFRAYYMQPAQGLAKPDAAKKAAQIVANIIDFSDGNFDASGVSNPTSAVGEHPRNTGPFYDAAFTITDNSGTNYSIDYKQQVNLDYTFLTEQIIDAMILEVSHYVLGGDVVNPAMFDFGLGSEVVFGYERQPFISEIYAERDTSSGTPLEFAIELVNPYLEPIDLTGWKLRIGSSYETPDGEFDGKTIPKTDLINGPGRFVIYNKTGPYTDTSYTHYWKVAGMPLTFTTGDCKIVLTRNAPAGSGETEIIVDAVDGDDYNKDVANTIFQDGEWSSIRKDSGWSFIKPDYSITNTASIGSSNDPNSASKVFQLAVPDDGEAVSRWGDIEVLSLYGNPSFDIDPNNPITSQIESDPNEATFDLRSTPDVLAYISPMNRPDKGSLPGRININTAPLHVIAVTLPPSLIRLKNDPNTAVDVAQMIIDKRPYTNIAQLLDLDFFTRLTDDDDNITFTNGVGDDQNIKDDIEERDWFMTYLANKFTVRSDTFTAYILVRLGEEGPQRRMIGIFDRSGVWDTTDRPKLVALHPVPDPR